MSSSPRPPALTGRARGDRPLRLLMVNEAVGGHVTMHLHIRRALPVADDVEVEVIDVPRPTLLRKLVGAQVPGLARLDLDLQPLRNQLAAALWVRRELRRRRGTYDALHFYSHNAALLAVPQLVAAPSVVSTDTTNRDNAYGLPYRLPSVGTPASARIGSQLERRVLRAADAVVGQSDWAADLIRSEGAVPPEKVRTIRYGITVPDRPTPVPTPRPEITLVGHDLTRKGSPDLLELVRGPLRGRCTLNLVTTGEAREEDGVRVVRGVTPGSPELTAVLARTSVFAFPSTTDKSSFAVVEAMAHGLPVVTYDHAANGELVGHDEGGLVVPWADRVALGHALGRLLDDGTLRRRLADGARARVERLYDARRTTAELVDLVRSLAEARRAGGVGG